MAFLPVTKQEMDELSWDRPDFILITADAYVDHPSFGSAVISRVLESQGFKVAILPQPDWRDLNSFTVLGKPKYAFLINGGNMDPMVSNYTAAKKPRKTDAYSPGGKTGLRPDRATIVYSLAVRKLYKKVPVIIGGIEASLRRLGHYDYWDNKVRKSILIDSMADLLIYGMGERQTLEICKKIKSGESIKKITDIPGTCYRTQNPDLTNALLLPDFNEIKDHKLEFAKSFGVQYRNTDPVTGNVLVEKYSGEWVIQNPPAMPLSREELDWVHGLPYQRNYHPIYEALGGIKAIEEVKFSLISSRGCYGSCNFCALTFHQGRIVQSRSKESLLDEAKKIIEFPDFKGYIHDVGGPTANFRKPSCQKQLSEGVCKNKNCLAPEVCKKMEVDHSEFLDLLRALRGLKGVKKVFIRSGIRFDYLMEDRDDTFFKELVEHHISGQLKVAPEHISDNVLKYMGKPGNKVFSDFAEKYKELNKEAGKEQYLVPYFISSHPGGTLDDAIALGEYLRDTGLRSEQVQDFIPTPGTVSTVMFYTGFDPLTLEKVYVVNDALEKAMHRALLQYKKPENYDLVKTALIKCNRTDLIGNDHNCFISKTPPRGFINNRLKSQRSDSKKDLPVSQRAQKGYKKGSRR